MLFIIAIILAAVIGLVLVIALFVKKEMGAVREVVISQPVDTVFNYVKLLKNQTQYSKWATMDKHMKNTFTGTDGTVGFISAWDSNEKNVGKGEQEITGVTEGRRIDYALRFIKPFKSVATTYMTTEAINENSTSVKWGFAGKMNYPLNIMRLFMDMNKSIGDDFSVGLERLKTNLEGMKKEQPPEAAFNQ